MTQHAFYRLISPFVSGVHDSHTGIIAPYSLEKPGLPLDFKIIDKSLCVSGVYSRDHEKRLGSLLWSVEGVGMDELCKRMERLRGGENEYFTLYLLAKRLCYRETLRDLVPEWKGEKTIRVALQDPDGQKREHLMEIIDSAEIPVIRPESEINLPSIKKCDFVYSFLDDRRQSALLRIDNMMTYREAFEFWNNSQYTGNNDQAFPIYQRFHGQEPPGDIDKVISGLPAFTDVLTDLVREMKQAETQMLIIDLRKNVGGISLMTEILVYFLYGKDMLKSLTFESKNSAVKKYSDFYFDHYEFEDIEKINKGRPYALTANDYDFSHDIKFSGQTEKHQAAWTQTLESMRKMTTFYKEYRSGEHSAFYKTPQVVVLCSAGTFSSGHTMMYRLYRAGATLVGIPSAQACNCFGEIIMFKLEHSDLKAYVSHKYYQDFPDNPQIGTVLMPHFVLTYKKLTEYNFDPNSEILFALEVFSEL